MSLGVALQIAQGSLSSLSRQTNVVARNVSQAGDATYVRRDAMVADPSNGTRVEVVRAQLDGAMVKAGRDAVSSGAAQTKIATAMRNLDTALHGVDGTGSLLASVSRLEGSLHTWSGDPANGVLASATSDAARDLTSQLNNASATITTARSAADGAIAGDVGQLNALLADFETANGAVVEASLAGRTDNNALDQRDALLRDISSIIQVAPVIRRGDDMLLVTAGGATLFETVPRDVGFSPSPILAPGDTGGTVTVDGLPLRMPGGTGSAQVGGSPPARAGSLMANLHLRDTLLPEAREQIDTIAANAINAFAETATGQPDRSGLFAHSGSPATATVTPGLADEVTLAAAFDPTLGGSMDLLRDGGANGAAYLLNTASAPGFADRLVALSDILGATKDTASTLVGWTAQQVATSEREAGVSAALITRLDAQRVAEGGVDIDTELTLLLELERGYEASARMLTTADNMLATLLQAVR